MSFTKTQQRDKTLPHRNHFAFIGIRDFYPPSVLTHQKHHHRSRTMRPQNQRLLNIRRF